MFSVRGKARDAKSPRNGGVADAALSSITLPETATGQRTSQTGEPETSQRIIPWPKEEPFPDPKRASGSLRSKKLLRWYSRTGAPFLFSVSFPTASCDFAQRRSINGKRA
jgi:hypothetical protein